MSQADSKGVQRFSSLSAEAAEFVPSSSGQVSPKTQLGGSQVPVAKVPSYLTTCYPFVQVDQPPCSVSGYRWQNPGAGKQAMGGKPPRPIAPQGGLLRTPWAQMAPVPVPYLNVGGMGAAGMPFDGGTSAGDGLLPTPAVYPFAYPSVGFLQGAVAGGVGAEVYGGTRVPPSGTVAPKTSGKQGRQDVSGWGRSGAGTKHISESERRPHTIIMKDMSCQTDFSEEFADLTLSERPNLLFQPRPKSMRSKGSQRNVSSDSEVDSDSGYSSPLVRRNLISNGTQPAGSYALVQASAVRATTATSPQGTAPSPSPSPSLPQPRIAGVEAKAAQVAVASTVAPAPVTYAMMAQGKKSSAVRTAVPQTGVIQCGDVVSPQLPGTVPKTVKGGAKSDHPLGRGGSANSVGVTVSTPPGARSAEQRSTEQCSRPNDAYSGSVTPGVGRDVRGLGASYSGVLGSNPEPGASDHPSRGVQGESGGSEQGSSLGTHSSPPLHHPSEVKSYSQVAASGKHWASEPSKTAPLAVASVRQVGREPEDEDDGEKKRRRRRRNRRRNRQRDNEGDDPSCAGSELSRTSTEVTLHFEDEEEFPDLVAQGNQGADSLLNGQASLSYSQALRVPLNQGTMERGMGEEWPAVPSAGAWNTLSVSPEPKTDVWPAVGAKESKHARKRRKRREMANQAAEEELAEIGLEQQMLLGLQNKGPQPVMAPLPSTSAVASARLMAGPVPVQQVEEPVRKGGLISSQAVVQEARSTAQTPPAGKKSKAPIALDFGAMIDALEKKKEESKKDDSKLLAGKKDSKQAKALNVLDSSGVTTKRGKERETPKPKKPSPLKKVILKEREEKKKLRLLDEDGAVLNGDGASVGVGVVNAESDLSQDGLSSKSSQEMGTGASTSADLSPISQTSPISMSPLSPGPSPLSSGLSSPITGLYKENNPAVLKIHSRRFREYCTQVLDKEIDDCCSSLLQDLVRFQDRVFHRDPTKAKSRRRIVLGLREVSKHLKLRKIKCVVISPNLEKIQSKGGLDEALNNIINMCREQNVPFVFALGRRALGRACAKLVPVSVVGIFNYEGSEANFHKLIDLTQKARDAYKEMLSAVEREIAEFPRLHGGPASSNPTLFAHMGHSRTPSGCSVISFTSSILSEPISENYPYSEPETDSKGSSSKQRGHHRTLSGASALSFASVFSEPISEDFPLSEPPTDSRGYEIVRSPEKTASSFPRAVLEIDDGNEADTEDCTEMTHKVISPLATSDQSPEGAVSDDVQVASLVEEEEDYEDDEDVEGDEDGDSQGALDTVNELPHIDSIHTSSFDLSAEILSQHSARTLENSEVLSTHSSRTVGDCGSATLTSDPERPRPDSARAGTGADNSAAAAAAGAASSRVRLVDKDRIQSWVDASQTLLRDVPEGSAQEENGSDDEDNEDGTDGSDAYESACGGESDLEVVANVGDVSKGSGE